MTCVNCYIGSPDCVFCHGSGKIEDRRLSEHFRLSEFVLSGKAQRERIPNMPQSGVIANMVVLCGDLLEPLRAFAGPVNVTSGYRSERLNPLIGGAPSSSHRYQGRANAADVEVGIPRRDVMEWLRASKLAFDQAIAEERGASKWLHLSSRHHDGAQRKQLLMSFDGRTYEPWNASDPRAQS